MAVALTRIYLKYPVRDNDLVLDVVEAIGTILAFTGGATIATIGARVQILTNARDNKSIYIAADNIGGLETIAGIVN